jgi:ribosomal protein L37AE/L43A
MGDSKYLYTAGCPHDANGRHIFEPRYSIKVTPILGSIWRKETKKYECDVCKVCGITTKEISKIICHSSGCQKDGAANFALCVEK